MSKEIQIFIMVGDKKERVLFASSNLALKILRSKLNFGKGIKFIDQEGYPVATQDEEIYDIATVLTEGKTIKCQKEEEDVVEPINVALKDYGLDKIALDKPEFLKFPGMKAKLAALIGTSVETPKISTFTRKEWEFILQQNNLLNGIVFVASGPQRTSYPLFVVSSTSNQAMTINANALQKSTVKTVEVNSEFASSIATFGFSQLEVSAKASIFGVGVSAAYGQKNNSTTQNSAHSSKSHFTTTYQYPMCEIDLNQTHNHWMKLNPQFTSSVTELLKKYPYGKIVNAGVEPIKEFYAIWGSVFPQKVTLGGQLQHTSLETKESSSAATGYTSEKKFAAAVNARRFNVEASGGIGEKGEEEKTNQKGSAAINFEAVGGNTLLANAPSLWISSVEHFKNWATIKVEKVVHVTEFMQEADKTKFNGLLAECSYSNPIVQIVVRYSKSHIVNITTVTKNGAKTVFGGLGDTTKEVVNLQGNLSSVSYTVGDDDKIMRSISFIDSFGITYGPYGNSKGADVAPIAEPGKCIKTLTFGTANSTDYAALKSCTAEFAYML